MAATFSDIHLKCRICLGTENEMTSLFEPLSQDLSVMDMLKSISNIQVEENDKMPKNACRDCIMVIVKFDNLMKLFLKTEEYLRSFIKKNEFYSENGEFGDFGNLLEDTGCENKSFSASSDEEDCDFKHTEEIIDSDKLPRNLFERPEITHIEEKVDRVCTQSDINVNKESSCGELVTIKNEEIETLKYSCEDCGDCFLIKSGFCQHMVQKHNLYIDENDYGQYSTKITIKVPKTSPENAVKINRKNYYVKLSNFQCQICRDTFLTGADLKAHYDVHKTHVCDFCGAAFIKNSYLRDHLLMHSAERRFECNVCGKKFKYRNGLAVHKNSHINFRGFMCDTCGQGFNTRNTLTTHMKLKHTDEKKFHCPECELSFKVKAWLDKHFSRKHTLNRKRDFVCSMCGMAYLNKTTLTRHVADKHTGTSKRHYCNVCEKSYTMRNKLHQHMQNKHSIILNTKN